MIDVCVTCVGGVDVRNAYRIMVEVSENRRPRGRSKHRWEDYITLFVRRIFHKSTEFLDRLVNLKYHRDVGF
jgi:hypothetical protein